ncbi:hypothetical protein CYLTODRAFT_494118 [Cylindrobasidium torrendii FP15055 ss-10]|uniref:Uncharacterized protein n=1 Tax=Cylindrobasidium torrendii FP15055 ss-10 TaxID=1314674 RepID=A0A0D7AY39_9AGAR|nr:hypothetical protein CYLTODRAFT_494118 [Cylindrobasidium torrendii FP15055 ss-10]
MRNSDLCRMRSLNAWMATSLRKVEPLNSTVHIDALPNEILTMIFRLSCLETTVYSTLVTDRLQREYIMSVCKRWNYLVVREPMLWMCLQSNVVCDCSAEAHLEEDLENFFLAAERAGTRPLHVSHEGDEMHALVKPQFQNLLPRIQSLEFRDSPLDFIVKALPLFTPSQMGRLQRLSIRCLEPERFDIIEMADQLSSIFTCQSLQDVSLFYTPIPFHLPAPLPSLQSFKISTNQPLDEEHLEALRNMPNLVHLTIRCGISLREGSALLDNIPTLPLLHLQTLSLCADCYSTQLLLGNIVAPRFKSLELTLAEALPLPATRFSQHVLWPLIESQRFAMPVCKWLKVSVSKRAEGEGGSQHVFLRAFPSEPIGVEYWHRCGGASLVLGFRPSHTYYRNQMTRRIFRSVFKDVEVIDARIPSYYGPDEKSSLDMPRKWWKIVFKSLPCLRRVLVDIGSKDYFAIFAALDAMRERHSRWAPWVERTQLYKGDPKNSGKIYPKKGWVEIHIGRPTGLKKSTP